MFIINFYLNTQISEIGLLHKKDFTANIYVFLLVTERHIKCSNWDLFSPEDGHNDARNMSRQKLIINI